ncbi:hypothetical protein J1605_010538 [Eschrichtius robustus]|uniref:Uncharacterized protein n=1 Tax=Eschrichtius robustus TaxID=9764 RepID=A0AB34GU75_ESCRO|nr:hypothetical protein J1605_010538 [Eschrichtius robustus]
MQRLLPELEMLTLASSFHKQQIADLDLANI